MTARTTPRAQARAERRPPTCWCGQDLEFARPGQCPRCGNPDLTRSGVVPLAQTG